MFEAEGIKSPSIQLLKISFLRPLRAEEYSSSKVGCTDSVGQQPPFAEV